MMNKIVLEQNKLFLKDNSVNYINVLKEEDINIIVDKNMMTKLVIVSNSNMNLCIHLEENSELTVNSLNKNNNVNINIELENDSKIIYNHSVLSDNDSINNYCIKHLKSNSTSILNNYGVNRGSSKLYFCIDGVIPKNLNNISCNQNSKIINFDNGDAKIIPNLIIDSNDIIANHSAYVGEIDEETKFYLASRGIQDSEIEKLIYKATLLGKMELNEEKEEFNNLINEWW